MVTRDYNYSRPLDVHRWSCYPETNTFVNSIYEQHFLTDKAKQIEVILNYDGAQGETRTLTVSLPADFESAASTIPPLGHKDKNILALTCFQLKKSRVQFI